MVGQNGVNGECVTARTTSWDFDGATALVIIQNPAGEVTSVTSGLVGHINTGTAHFNCAHVRLQAFNL